MKKRKEKILKNIKTYILSNYKKINHKNMILGEAYYNHKCHLNAVQKIKEEKAIKVWLCLSIDKDNGFVYVHFINQLKDNKFQDNTFGWIYTHYDYYLIREVQENEYDSIWDLLINTKDMLFNLHSNWFDKNILKITRDII